VLKRNLYIKADIGYKYFKPLMFMAFPIMIQGLVFQLQVLVNRVFLGNINKEYLYVIGNTMVPYYTVIEVLVAIAMGITILISQNLSEDERSVSRAYTEASISFNSIICVLFFLMWYFLSKDIFSLMGVDKSQIGYCVSYIKILSFYMLVFGIDISMQSALAGTGDTKPLMYAGLCKVAVNVILDWILIFGKFGFPALGIQGSAYATTIANFVSFAVTAAWFLAARKTPIKISLEGILKWDWKNYINVVKLGLPTGFETISLFVGNLVIISFLNGVDKISAGVYTLIMEIDVLVFLMYNGVARAALTLVGQFTGAKNKREAKSVLSASVFYNLVMVILIFLPFVLFAKQILSIFTNDSALISNSAMLLIISAVAFFPKCLNVTVGSGIRGLGDTKWMLYTQILGTLLLVTGSYAMLYVFKMGIAGVFIVIFIDESIRSTLNIYRFCKE
jgi:putative MATE family efflux protein